MLIVEVFYPSNEDMLKKINQWIKENKIDQRDIFSINQVPNTNNSYSNFPVIWVWYWGKD